MVLRIQSLFFLFTAIATGLLFYMPVASIVVPSHFTYEFYTTKVVQSGQPDAFITWNWLSMVLNTVITTLAVLTILVHRKKNKTVRPTLFLQFRLSVVNIILQLGLVVLMWLQVRSRASEINGEWFANISFVFPFIGVIFTWLAIRGIIKDIALLKSFDRVR